MGAFLGAILINGAISGVEGLDFLGIPVPTVEYGGSVVPVIVGVIFMYYVDKMLEKVIPEFGKYLLKPFLTMLIVVPFTLILFGPAGTVLSTYVGTGIQWLLDTLGFIAMPILAVTYPYMVMGFISNFAVAFTVKNDNEKNGHTSPLVSQVINLT